MKYNATLIGVFIMVVSGYVNSASVMAQGNYESLNVVMRVIPNHRSYVFKCAAINTGSQDVEIPVARKFMADGNSFAYIELDDESRRRSRIGVLTSFVELPAPLVIAGKAVYKKYVDKTGIFNPGGDIIIGRYVDLFWFIGKIAPSVTVAFSDADGIIASPVVDPRNPDAKPILAFIFHDNRPYELGFLFLNGSRQDIGVEKPLTKESRIIVSSPAIGYTRELFIAASASERIVVEAGKVGEWRLPWQTVLNLIPKEDLERIKAAGGDLDLVWKVGEYQSDPLPLSLADPENITRSSEK